MNTVQRYIQDYKIENFIGKGGYGEVYRGVNYRSNEQCAIKVSKDKEALLREYEIIIDLQHDPEFISVYDYKQLPEFDALIIELLGNSLEYKAKDKIFSLNCIYAIGIKLIRQLEKIHDLGILHRDLKPANFLVTLNKKNIKLIDFGIANYFMIRSKHKEFKTRRKCKGTACFASINTHLGFRQSRRDDIESLCYSLIYLLTGCLPWELNSNIQGFKKWQLILSHKINLGTKFLSVPKELLDLLQYSRKLSYTQRPNYCYMITLLSRNVHLNHLYVYFDWYDLKNDSNLNNSQQIVEGATIITKLKREKKFLRKFKKRRGSKIIFEGRKISSYGTIEKYLCSNLLEQGTIDKSEEKEMRENFAPVKMKQFLELPTCDSRFNRKKKFSEDIEGNSSNIEENQEKNSYNLVFGEGKKQLLELPTFDSRLRMKSKMSGNIKRIKSNTDIWKDDSCGVNKEPGKYIDGSKEFKQCVHFSNVINIGIGEFIDDLSYGEDTARSIYPEFKNRNLIFKNKNDLNETKKVDENYKCSLF